MKKMYDLKKRGEKDRVETSDGSITLYSNEFQECYHSVKDGALRESLKKHIEIAFKFHKHKKRVTILDVCFGIGYNTLSTLYYVKKNSLEMDLEIISPEFDRELVKSLQNFPYPKEFDSLRDVIVALSREGYYQDDKITIKILLGDARKELPKITKKVDVVYQDPFSPKKNPLLWTKEYFLLIKSLASDDMIITTYSVATRVRVGLWEVGFYVYEYPQSTVRDGTVASMKPIEGLKRVDVASKLARNREIKGLRDGEFL